MSQKAGRSIERIEDDDSEERKNLFFSKSPIRTGPGLEGRNKSEYYQVIERIGFADLRGYKPDDME